MLWVLSCFNNQLTSLDVSKNTNLGTLSCSHNQLTSLDVSKNTNLGTLYCFNNQLTELDVSKNTNLGIVVPNERTSGSVRVNISQVTEKGRKMENRSQR